MRSSRASGEVLTTPIAHHEEAQSISVEVLLLCRPCHLVWIPRVEIDRLMVLPRSRARD